jgi:hypothetical protein
VDSYLVKKHSQHFHAQWMQLAIDITLLACVFVLFYTLLLHCFTVKIHCGEATCTVVENRKVLLHLVEDDVKDTCFV